METTYDIYRRRYLVEDSSNEAAELESDPMETALREHIHVLRQQLAIAEAELAAAETITR